MFNPGLLSNISIFELFVSKIKKLSELARQKFPGNSQAFTASRQNEIPILIMTSESNFAETKQFFDQKNFFDYPSVILFTQTMLPSIYQSGRIILGSKSRVQFNPNGNGGLYQTLDHFGLTKLLKSQSVEYMHITGIDNILCKLADPLFLGYIANNDLDLMCKYSKRKGPTEAVGVHAIVNGKSNVIEYSVIGAVEAERVDQDGELYWNHAHLLNFVIRLDALDHILDSKYAIAHRYNVAFKSIGGWDLESNIKTVPPKDPNGYKFEVFIFEGFSLLDVAKCGLLEIDRDEEFAPIKNLDEK